MKMLTNQVPSTRFVQDCVNLPNEATNREPKNDTCFKFEALKIVLDGK